MFLDSYFCIPVPFNEKDIFFWVLVLDDLVGLFIELFNFTFFRLTGWGIDLNYWETEWFALEMDRDHSVIFEIAPKYCILDYFVDYEDVLQFYYWTF